MIRSLLALSTFIVLFFAPQWLPAQAYPKQPINLIIPLAPGDATDVAGRTIGEGISKLLKVPVVAVNRPGAGGTIGTDSAVKAPKDGYTILITNNASLVFNRILTPEAVPYDPFKDLTPIGMAVRTPIILAVHKATRRSKILPRWSSTAKRIPVASASAR